MLFSTFTRVAVVVWASVVLATQEKPAQDPILGTDTVHGCYSSVGKLTLNSSPEFNTQGECAKICRALKKPVGASNSYDCYCGDEYPNKQYLVDDSKCTEPCPGFKTEACGGLDTYTIYNIGVRQSVAESDPDTSSSSSSSSAASTPTPQPTESTGTDIPVVTSPPPESTPEPSPTNTTGIAVGVVVGIVALSGIGAAVFFYMRRKKNTDLEEEHRRNAAVNAFISGGKPPGSSGGLSMSDSRLDPVLNRRLSDGSIADNQDYSRRILRVTNA